MLQISRLSAGGPGVRVTRSFPRLGARLGARELVGAPIGGGTFSGFSAGAPFEASVIFAAKAGDVLTLRNLSQANRMIIPRTACGNLCATGLALSIKKIGE